MLIYTNIQEVISMKVLFIGGTGTISSAIVRNLAEEGNWDIWLINRGNRNDILPDGVHQIIADINDEKTVADAIRDLTFDAVCEFIGFRVPDVERDYRLFNGKTRQYIYTSSASAYNKEYSSIQGRISTFPVSISYIAPITARPSSSSFRITRLLSMRSILLFTFRQQAL